MPTILDGKFHIVEDVTIENGQLKMVIDGMTVIKDLEEVSSRLVNAKPEAQQEFEISPSGYGIHWPLIDEDISVDGLLGIVHAPERKRRIA